MGIRPLCGLSLLLAVLCGCGGGPKLTPVSGTVTFNGSPVENATVTFAPDSGTGPACVGSTDSSGNYTLGCNLGAGCPPGAYSVKIKSKTKPAVDSGNPMEGLTPGSPEYIEAYKQQMSGGRPNYKEAKKDSNSIPERYASGSELKALVDAGGAQVIDFALEK